MVFPLEGHGLGYPGRLGVLLHYFISPSAQIFFTILLIQQHQGQSHRAHLNRLGSLLQHFPAFLGSWHPCWFLGPQRQSRPCTQFLTKLQNGGSVADTDPWAASFFPISWPPFLCPFSGHCVPERQVAWWIHWTQVPNFSGLHFPTGNCHLPSWTQTLSLFRPASSSWPTTDSLCPLGQVTSLL